MKFLSSFKKDIILIFSILLIACIGILIFYFMPKPQSGIVKIIENGKFVKQLPLNEDTTYTHQTDRGTNTIEIKDNKVSVINADCKNHICMKHYAISKNGETIICLPHHLVILIQESTSSSADFVI